MEKPKTSKKPIYNMDRTSRILYVMNGRWTWQNKKGDATDTWDGWESEYTGGEFERAAAKLAASNKLILEQQKKKAA